MPRYDIAFVVNGQRCGACVESADWVKAVELAASRTGVDAGRTPSSITIRPLQQLATGNGAELVTFSPAQIRAMESEPDGLEPFNHNLVR